MAPRRKPKPKGSRTIHWAVDADAKMWRDLYAEGNKGAYEWYQRFLHDYYGNGPGATKDDYKRTKAQRRDAMNYGEHVALGPGLVDVPGSDYGAFNEDYEYTSDPLYQKLLAEYRETLKDSVRGGYPKPTPDARRDELASALKLFTGSSEYLPPTRRNNGSKN